MCVRRDNERLRRRRVVVVSFRTRPRVRLSRGVPASPFDADDRAGGITGAR
jgi:hypothetical protein